MSRVEIYGQHYMVGLQGCRWPDDNIYDAVWLVYQSISLPPIFQRSRVRSRFGFEPGNLQRKPRESQSLQLCTRSLRDSIPLSLKELILLYGWHLLSTGLSPFSKRYPSPRARRQSGTRLEKLRFFFIFFGFGFLFNLSCSALCCVHPWFVLYTMFEINLNCVTDCF